LLDRSGEEFAVVPPLGHWLYCLPVATHSDIGPDGHIALGQNLPPLGLPRRMWAGSRVDFRGPLRTGSRITRQTTIKSISKKQGSSGPLAFVTLFHEISADGVLTINEEHDLVYREAQALGSQSTRAVSGAVVEASGHVRCVIRLDPVQLFRFRR
jgi:3-methylfumaryl-CoA hydratase